MSAPGLTPEQIGRAFAEAASDDGWVAARPPGQVAGSAREWWPGPLAVLRAVGDASTLTWVTDPDGFDLEVARPGEPPIRFAVPNHHDANRPRDEQTSTQGDAPIMTQPTEPEGFRLAPAAVLGAAVNVFPALDDAAIAERVRECALAQGMDRPDARRFAGQAAGIIRGFEFECCTSCGGDLDRHELGTDALGNAHAYCLPREGLPARARTAPAPHGKEAGPWRG
jgi:hypothetical protein